MEVSSSSWGYPNSWLPYFMENLTKIRMITRGRPPFSEKSIFHQSCASKARFFYRCDPNFKAILAWASCFFWGGPKMDQNGETPIAGWLFCWKSHIYYLGVASFWEMARNQRLSISLWILLMRMCFPCWTDPGNLGWSWFLVKKRWCTLALPKSAKLWLFMKWSRKGYYWFPSNKTTIFIDFHRYWRSFWFLTNICHSLAHADSQLSALDQRIGSGVDGNKKCWVDAHEEYKCYYKL